MPCRCLTTGILVAFVGRLIPEKGALRLAQAVQQLPGCVLAVAGTGPEEEALRALGAPVHVLGALPHPQIVQLLDQADCYCLPTEYAEGFPTTLLEAAACRCPIVCTHYRRYRRTAARGRLCRLPAGYPAPIHWPPALRTVLQDPAAARTRADNALHNLQAHFTWQAVFATMMKIAQSAPSRR